MGAARGRLHGWATIVRRMRGASSSTSGGPSSRARIRSWRRSRFAARRSTAGRTCSALDWSSTRCSPHGAFERSTTLETLHAILNEAAPPLPETVPEDLRRIVGRCLEKDREQRMSSAADLAAALRSVNGSLHRLSIDDGTARTRRWWRLDSAALWAGLVLVAVGFGLMWSLKASPGLRVTGFSRITNDGQLKTGGLVTDGSQLYLTEVANNEPVMTGTKISTS